MLDTNATRQLQQEFASTGIGENGEFASEKFRVADVTQGSITSWPVSEDYWHTSAFAQKPT
jgi:hypothetical protein